MKLLLFKHVCFCCELLIWGLMEIDLLCRRHQVAVKWNCSFWHIQIDFTARHWLPLDCNLPLLSHLCLQIKQCYIRGCALSPLLAQQWFSQALAPKSISITVSTFQWERGFLNITHINTKLVLSVPCHHLTSTADGGFSHQSQAHLRWTLSGKVCCGLTNLFLEIMDVMSSGLNLHFTQPVLANMPKSYQLQL